MYKLVLNSGACITRAFFDQGRRLVCWLPVGVALGSVGYFALKAEPAWWFCAVVAFAILAGCGFFFGSSRIIATTLRAESVRFWGRLVGAALISIGAGFLLALWQAERQPPMSLIPMESVWLEGRVVSVEEVMPRIRVVYTGHEDGAHNMSGDEPEDTEETREQRWRIGLAGAVFDSPWWEGMPPLKRRVFVTLKAKDAQGYEVPHSGQYVRLRALLRAPAQPVVPGGYDGQRAAWFLDKAGAGMALSWPEIGVGKVSLWLRMTTGLEGVRERVAYRIEHDLPGQKGAVAAAVLCGETGTITSATRQEYAASGLAHLLAVAGLHLGFVMGFAFWVASRAMRLSQYVSASWPCREIALAFSWCVGLGYVLLTGGHLPGIRALGMAGIAVLALWLRRPVVSMRALAVVALAVECVSPVMVLDVSFQMSCAAVMALIAGYELLRKPLACLAGYGEEGARYKRGQLWRRAGVGGVSLAVTSLLAGFAALPVSMAHFGALQPWFVFANLVAVPVMGMWCLPSGVVAVLLMPFGCSAVPLRVMGWGLEIISAMAHGVAHAPFASWAVPSFPRGALLGVMLGLAALCLWRGYARLIGAGLIICAVASVWLVARPVMVIAGDGHILAVRTKEGMQLVGEKVRDAYTQQELWRALGRPVAGDGVPECHDAVCSLPLKNGQFILWGDGQGDMMRCAHAALEVHVQNQRPLCPGVRRLGPGDVRRDGSLAVYDEGRDGVRIVSERSVRGERLWSGGRAAVVLPPLPYAHEE